MKKKIFQFCAMFAALVCLGACGGGTSGASESDLPSSSSLSAGSAQSSEELVFYAFVPEGILVLPSSSVVTVRAICGEGLDEADVLWRSSDASVATVEAQGALARISTVFAGECTITLTCGEASDSFTVVVRG